MPVLFGVAASLLIGVSDYFGRYVARRSVAITTVIASLAVGVAGSLALVAVVPSAFTARDFGLGAASGGLVAIALALLYGGMSRSSSAVVSPIVGLGGVLVPVLFDVLTGEIPEGLEVVGFAVAIVSLLLTTFSPELGDRVWVGVTYGAGAGIAFGASLLLIGRTDIDSGMWAAVGQRLVGLVFLLGLATAWSRPRLLPPELRITGALTGLAGIGGIACFIAGAQRGSLAVVAVSGSMFPAVTAVLTSVFDEDVLRWWQMVGIAGVLTGVGLIAAA
jgi:drug/metabolite transporter (DMT)-like permease